MGIGVGESALCDCNRVPSIYVLSVCSVWTMSVGAVFERAATGGSHGGLPLRGTGTGNRYGEPVRGTGTGNRGNGLLILFCCQTQDCLDRRMRGPPRGGGCMVMSLSVHRIGLRRSRQRVVSSRLTSLSLCVWTLFRCVLNLIYSLCDPLKEFLKE